MTERTPPEASHERRVFCARSDRRVMLLDDRAIDRQYDRARLDEADGDDLEIVRTDPDASWSPVAYQRSSAGTAVVTVCGPLEHHGGWWFDCYDSIKGRVSLALADDSVRAIVLRIDSPGGVANGMVETSREIRSKAAAKGVPVYAYADEQMTSAAYGLACAADEIWCPETGEVGSVGVILPVLDWTRANEKQGIRTALLTTGARKGDGHPDKPLTSDVRDALQVRVDAIGVAFFSLVAESRGVKPEAIEALEAGVFIGEAAEKAGLVDGVAGWGDFFATVESSVGGSSAGRSTVAARATMSAKPGKNASAKARLDSGTVAGIQPKGAVRRAAKDQTMKLLDLVKAKDAQKAALAQAHAVSDPKKRAKAVAAADALYESAMSDLAAVATYDAKSKMWKKTTKIEEDDGEDDGEDKDTSTPGSDDDGDASEDASEEDESDDDAPKGKASAYSGEPRGYMSDSLHTPKRLLAHVREVTGERDLPSAMTKLAEMAAKAAAYEPLSKRVEKIETDGRSAKVKSMVDDAIKDGRAFPAQRASLVAMGMRDRASLKSFLASSPKRISVEAADLREQPDDGADDHRTEMVASGLDAKKFAAAEQTAKAVAAATGRPYADCFAEVVKEGKKALRDLRSGN